MVTLRATQKVLRLLPPQTVGDVASDTALGDWYVNRIVIDRQPLLLLLSSSSLLAIIEPARELKKLPERLPGLVERRLRRLPLTDHIVACEVAATRRVSIGKTASRSVVGQMVEFAKELAFYLPVRAWGAADLLEAEERFADTPCRCSGPDKDVVWPESTAIRLLEQTWPSNSARH